MSKEEKINLIIGALLVVLLLPNTHM